MMEDLVSKFLGSGAGTDAIAALTKQHGLSQEQAKGAVSATAEGGIQALTGMLGAGAAAKGVGGLGALAGLTAAPTSPTVGGVPIEVMKKVSAFVATKTGLQPPMAEAVVGKVLPKVFAFAKGQTGL